MSKDEVIVRTYEEADQNQLYNLLSEGLKGIMENGKINFRTVTLVFLEFVDKLGVIKFLLTNTIIFNLIFLLFRFNFPDYPFILSILFFLLFWGIIFYKNIKISNKLYLSYVSSSIDNDYKEPLSWIKDGISHLWVACLSSDRSKVVASLGIIQFDNDKRIPQEIKKTIDQKVVQLMRLYVDDEYRNRGIASKLIQTAENWSRKNGYKQIILSTSGYQTEAVKLYLKKGYRIIHKFCSWNFFFAFSQIIYFLKDV